MISVLTNSRLLLLITSMLAACTTTNPNTGPGQGSESSAALANISNDNLAVRFENRLAEKLFHLAVQEILETDTNHRFETIDSQYRNLSRALNPARMSASNQQQLRLFRYLWDAEHKKCGLLARMSKKEQATPADVFSPREYNQIYLPQGGEFSKDTRMLEENARAELSRLHEEIRRMIRSGETRSNQQTTMQSIFRSAREDPGNYLSDTESGRQEYLTRIIDSLLLVEDHLHSYLSISNHKEFTIEGFEYAADASNSVISYDVEYATLRIGISDMQQLPLFEIEAAALYHGVPGMHSINSVAPVFEVQSLISLPGFEKGWAAYAISNLDSIPLYQDTQSQSRRIYFETMLASLAIVDLALHTRGWTQAQAISFLISNSPYPEDRLRNYVEQIIQEPGLFSAPLLISLEIQNLRNLSERSLEEKFELVEFNNAIVSAGPLPLPELKIIIDQWISDRQAAAN